MKFLYIYNMHIKYSMYVCTYVFESMYVCIYVYDFNKLNYTGT